MSILKKKIFLLLLLFIFFITACSVPIISKKNSNCYYTSQVIDILKANKSLTCIALDYKLYQEITLQSSEIDTLKNFLLNIKSTNYVSKPGNIPTSPKYRLFLYVGKTKYVADIYNDKYVALFPWDGTHKMDYIDMSSIPLNYNLFSLCKNTLPETGF